MQKNKLNLRVGDSVIVKKGVIDPDSGKPIDGFQGRIEKIQDVDGKTVLQISWDSITLKKTPISLIERFEEEGLDWRSYQLWPDDVEPAKARDTQKDVTKTIHEIENKIGWVSLGGAEGKRIHKILAGVDLDDEWGQLETWEEYLQDHLTFSFEAEISEYQEKGRLQAGDKLTVIAISDIDDKYGIIVKVKKGVERFEFPLCDLKVVGKKASKSNKQIVSDYAVWFANR
jgi:hypothetical protein